MSQTKVDTKSSDKGHKKNNNKVHMNHLTIKFIFSLSLLRRLTRKTKNTSGILSNFDNDNKLSTKVAT